MKSLLLLPLLAVGLLVTGCSTHRIAVQTWQSSAINAADDLADEFGTLFRKEKRAVVVGAFTNLHNLAETNELGRAVAAVVRTRLAEQGLVVHEARVKPPFLQVDPTSGDFTVNPELVRQMNQIDTPFFVYGNYIVTNTTITITTTILDTKKVSTRTGRVFQIPLNSETRSMVAN